MEGMRKEHTDSFCQYPTSEGANALVDVYAYTRNAFA